MSFMSSKLGGFTTEGNVHKIDSGRLVFGDIVIVCIPETVISPTLVTLAFKTTSVSCLPVADGVIPEVAIPLKEYTVNVQT